SAFDARRLLRSLAALFGTAFVVKHMLLASLYEPGGGWLKRLAGVALEGVTLGTLGGEPQSNATGYVSFFTLALYVLGLALLPPAPNDEAEPEASTSKQLQVRERVAEEDEGEAVAPLDYE
ncbi:MAG TPA: hypothetical protein VKB12_10100, partial [Pyrinomonadaceae bacterium]|nr:hypothetical protein [Pyrinomonadaceae bacterium]